MGEKKKEKLYPYNQRKTFPEPLFRNTVPIIILTKDNQNKPYDTQEDEDKFICRKSSPGIDRENSQNYQT